MKENLESLTFLLNGLIDRPKKKGDQ